MRPLKRRGRGDVQANHENRIQTLERRIPVDYPRLYSILLGDPGSMTGFQSKHFGWSFSDDCAGAGDSCDERFVTQGDYLLLPLGFFGQFDVTMQAALSGGSVANYLTPVTPGDITPSNGVKIGFVPYIATNDVVDTGSFIGTSVFIQNTQEPPPSRQGGYNRIWSHMRRIPGIAGANPETDRWALLPFAIVLAGFGPVTLTGLAMGVTLYPPEGSGGYDASWAG